MRIAFLAILICFSTLCHARSRNKSENDSTRTVACDTLKRDSLFTVGSVAFLPDSLIRDTLQYEFSKIKRFAYKTSITKELYKMVFVNPSPNVVNVMRTEDIESRFTPYKGKTIKNIHFKILRPYGYNVLDTTYKADELGWLERTANNFHTQTSERTLRKRMTIKPGMAVNPFEVVQNEILLRNLGYINDVYIYATPDEESPDEINLWVICQDDFSWGAEIRTNMWSNIKLSASNKNFVRNGHYLKYDFGYYGNKDKKYGNAVTYNVNSIFGSHIDLNAYYNNDYRSKVGYITIDKQFLTNTIKWAGGVGAYRYFRTLEYPSISPQNCGYPFNYFAKEFWLGHSWALSRKYNTSRNLYLTGKYTNIHFIDRPTTSVDSNQFYYNRKIYLSALTFQQLKYYRANLIYDFGRTELVPHGIFSEFLFGYEKSEYENAVYVGHQIKVALFNPEKNRYYGINLGIGGYFEDNALDRGVFNLNYHHVSSLFDIGRCKIRFYDDINYVKGIRRYPVDYLYFNDSDILGFESDSLYGMQKLVLSLSSTLFFPHIYRGFRTSLSAFMDIGYLSNSSNIVQNEPYWGMGIALNFRNDNVIFKHISIRFSYYPRIPPDMNRFEFSLDGRRKDSFYDFRIEKPKVIGYK